MQFPHPGGGPGFGFLGTVFTDILAGFVFVIVVVLVVAVLVVLVRFLLTATRAAELYIANNTAKDEPAIVETPPAAPTATNSPVITKPTPTRARTTKPPTA
jgi:hypothetical protein